MRLAPAPAGSGLINAAQTLALAGVSSAFQVIPQAGEGCWITVTFLGTTPATDRAARLRFGGAGITAAVAGDVAFVDGATQDYWCQAGVTGFRAIGTGELSWHRSSM